MSSRWSLFPLVPLLLAGCLQAEGPPPAGRRLVHGQNIETPGFIKVGDEDMIRFVDRKAFATSTHGGVSDLWITSFDGARQRKVVVNQSDYWGETGPYSANDRYFMVDERSVASGTGTARVATLVRLGATLEEEFRLDGISTYGRFTVPMSALYDQPQAGQTCPGFPSLQNDCPQLFFERPALQGQKYPTLYLWDGTNEIPIGADSGSFQVQTAGTGRSYFILDDRHTLERLLRPQTTLELLRENVSRFTVSGDERYAAVAVTDGGTSKTVILDLATGAEIPLARPNPSGWGGFGGNTFYYSQNATSTVLAELHSLDLTTGKDDVVTLPSPLANLAGILDRPESDERLVLDSLGQGVFVGKSDYVARRSLAGPLVTPSFTPDGNYLIYISPAAPTLYDTYVKGSLMFWDSELKEPASMVSPPGLLVNAQNAASYFFTDGDAGKILVFWAHLGRASSDLYFADYARGSLPTGLRLIAKSILSVSISAHTLFGIINMSQQDGVGDLVYRDIDKGTDILYSHAVADAAEHGGSDLSTSYVAYIVRGRADSDRSGLWLTTLAPPVTPDGGSN